jgi:alkanesulfonate monooxygenase SsuD/methylene tetrahydromethanopterin reductase-like flavin-dependent oxidoreductase (luciferase family)
VRTGIILPSFRENGDEALAAALDAEALGIDGVFCYDHLWPMGQPQRPALAPFPLLALLASKTTRICLGTLMARVGLVPNEVLLGEFGTIELLAPHRVIAGLGTGDSLSRAENEAYGVPFASTARRRADLSALSGELLERGIPVWVGSGSAATNAVARAQGAIVNVWDASPEQVAIHAQEGEVTWAGPSPKSDLAALVHGVARSGATWVVFAWPVDLVALVDAVRRLEVGR